MVTFFTPLRLAVLELGVGIAVEVAFSVNTQSTSSSSSEEASRPPSPVKSSRVRKDFSINLRQTSNPLYQEIPETMEFFPKDPFQSQHTDTNDREIEQGNHS